MAEEPGVDIGFAQVVKQVADALRVAGQRGPQHDTAVVFQCDGEFIFHRIVTQVLQRLIEAQVAQFLCFCKQFGSE